jgi:hypothetical protein
VGWRISFEDPGRWSARKYLLSRKDEYANRPAWGLTAKPYLLPAPSLPSLAEPENSMASVSPAIVLEQRTNSFPSSSPLTETLNGVFFGSVRYGKLAT